MASKGQNAPAKENRFFWSLKYLLIDALNMFFDTWTITIFLGTPYPMPPPNGDGCSVLLLMVPPLWPVVVGCLGFWWWLASLASYGSPPPPCGLWWWGVWDVGDGWYVCMHACMYVCMYITVPLPRCGVVGVWYCPPTRPVVWWGCGAVGGVA